jgi:hypothetical protein
MRTRIAATVLLLGACTTDTDPDVRIERQSATLADANAAAWAEGGAVLVADPGTFAFPQPLSIRISIVDSKVLDAEGAPTQLTIKTATLAAYETATNLEVVKAPACSQNFCTAELEVTGAGASMLSITADGPEGTQNDCFYFGVYEDSNPTVGTTHQAELEDKQSECRAMYWR